MHYLPRRSAPITIQRYHYNNNNHNNHNNHRSSISFRFPRHYTHRSFSSFSDFPYTWNAPRGNTTRVTSDARSRIHQHIAQHHPQLLDIFPASSSFRSPLATIPPSYIDATIARLQQEGITSDQIRQAPHLLRWDAHDVEQALHMLRSFGVPASARICALLHGNILGNHPRSVYDILQYMQELAQQYHGGEVVQDQVGLFIGSILKRNASIISVSRDKAEDIVEMITSMVNQKVDRRNELPRRILSTFLIQNSSPEHISWGVQVFLKSGLVSKDIQEIVIMHCLESLIRPRLFASLPYRAQWLAAKLGTPTSQMINLLPTRPEIFLITQSLSEKKIQVLTSLHTLIPKDWNEELKREMESKLKISHQELAKDTMLLKFSINRHIKRVEYFIERKTIPPTHIKSILKFTSYQWNNKFRI